jgi:hypothetical protein
MTKRNYIITNDKSLKGKHTNPQLDKIKNITNPKKDIIEKEKAEWEEKHKK